MTLIGIALVIFAIIKLADFLTEPEVSIKINYHGINVSEEDKNKIKSIILEEIEKLRNTGIT